MKDIKPGFLLKVVSWENDADNYNTWEKDGLSENDVRFYILMAKLFASKYDDAGAFGNARIPRCGVPDPMTEALEARVAGFVANGGTVPADWWGEDSLYDIIGIWNEGENYRVYESHSVVEVPEPGLKDVTEKFANV
jgi:hypothetical protein